jgi:hypothetical protein
VSEVVGNPLENVLATLWHIFLRVPEGIGNVSEHMGWVRNVVLMNVYSGSGKPWGVGILGRGGARWARWGNARVSLRAT